MSEPVVDNIATTYSQLHKISVLRDLIFPSWMEQDQIKKNPMPVPQTLRDFQSLQGKEATLEDYLDAMESAVLAKNIPALKQLVGETHKNWGKALPPIGKNTLSQVFTRAQGMYDIDPRDVMWFSDRLDILFHKTSLHSHIKPLGDAREPIPLKETRTLYLPELLTTGYYKSWGPGECSLDVPLGQGGGGFALTVDLAKHKDLKIIEVDDIINASDQETIANSKRALFKFLDGRAIATHSTSFRAGLSILADGVAAARYEHGPPKTGYYLMISSFGKQPIREFPKFTYDPSSQQPFPYVSITSTDPFLIFDGELLKERNLFIHHGYKSIDGKTLTADETVIGMWWPPKFRPFLIEWMNNLESTTREAIIGKRSPEEFFFTTL